MKENTAGDIAGPATQAGLRGSPGPVVEMPDMHTAPNNGVHEPKPQMAVELLRGTVQMYTLHSRSFCSLRPLC